MYAQLNKQLFYIHGFALSTKKHLPLLTRNENYMKHN